MPLPTLPRRLYLPQKVWHSRPSRRWPYISANDHFPLRRRGIRKQNYKVFLHTVDDPEKAAEMARLILDVKSAGDTIGGIITCVVSGCPVGMGEPEFDKLHAALGGAMLGINAVKGFEYGEGFSCALRRGSELNDIFACESGKVTTTTNHSGGVQGGVSNGQDIYFRVAFKPVATILQEQPTIDLEGNPTTMKARGRHDPCVLPRAVPIVEAMAAMVILDHYLLQKTVNC